MLVAKCVLEYVIENVLEYVIEMCTRKVKNIQKQNRDICNYRSITIPKHVYKTIFFYITSTEIYKNSSKN